MQTPRGIAAGRTDSGRPALELAAPSTFAERGVSVPFTTPALAGARARPRALRGRTGEAHGGGAPGGVPGGAPAGTPGGAPARRAPRLELLVPNPSGKEGVYVVGWSQISALCTPTLFDRGLIEAVAALPAITPAAIRGAVRAAACGGLAGGAASEAAAQAGVAEQQERLFAHVELLLALIRQGEARYGQEPGAPEAEAAGPRTRLEALERRARRVLARIGEELVASERGGEAIGAAVEQLAALFGGIGLGERRAAARLARLHEAVALLAREAGAAAARGNASARLVATVAAITARAAEAALGTARARTEDVVALLGAWANDATAVADALARADWLLDGWECLAAPQEAPRTDIDWQVLAGMLPVIPDEAAAWSAIALEAAADARRMQRRVTLGEDWRSGVTLADLVAANERALAWQLAVPEAAGAVARTATGVAMERGLAA